ncbi:MAG: type I-C CRISPR-associated protein Cas8c/Csd1 [Oscillospiraceae bacterium]
MLEPCRKNAPKTDAADAGRRCCAAPEAERLSRTVKSTLLSFRKDHQLQDTDCAVLVSFDAATTGRLAVTYYNEITLKTFLERIHDWDAHCCWLAGNYGIQAPNLLQLVDCAFGTQRNNFLETDDRIQRQHLQRLLNCKMNGGIFPLDILKALTQRASSPLAYDVLNWRKIVHAACAVLQKYRYDTKQGGNEMAWELDTNNRSFQYGRLLAVMERAEMDYYYKDKRKQADKCHQIYERVPKTAVHRV